MDAWIIALLSLVGTALFIFAVYLILIAPARSRDIKKYAKVKFAHRGLHGDGAAENSLTAFRAAADAGFGIELDVRLSKDGVLMVFHDDTLERVTAAEGRVDAYTAEELCKMRLMDTDDCIPTLDEVLKVVDGRVTLLVEIKEDPGVSAVSEALAKRLADYNGPYVVESFNPLSLATFSKALPKVSRGILSHRYYEYEKYRKPLYFLLQILLFNRICRPSFVAYDHRHAGSPALKLARHLGAVTYAWTVRSAEEERAAYKNGFDSVIFEGYIPDTDK